jgi:hypothetical protein
MIRRTLVVLATAVMVVGLMAPLAHAGEITGNGKSLHVENSKWGTGLHARSLCAYSGQEDLQFEKGGSKGVPAHAQSWGQIPKSVRDSFPAAMHPGMACNPMGTTLVEG